MLVHKLQRIGADWLLVATERGRLKDGADSAAAGEIMEMRVAPCLAQSLLMRLPAGPFEIRIIETTLKS